MAEASGRASNTSFKRSTEFSVSCRLFQDLHDLGCGRRHLLYQNGEGDQFPDGQLIVQHFPGAIEQDGHAAGVIHQLARQAGDDCVLERFEVGIRGADEEILPGPADQTLDSKDLNRAQAG